MRQVNRFLLFIEDRFFPNLGIIFFSVSLIWMLVEAISRQVFSKSFHVSEELITFSILWCMMFSMALAGKQGYHINIDIVTNKLPKKLQKILKGLTMILGMVFAALILISTYKYIPHLITTDVRSISPMRIPMWIVYLAIPVNGLLLLLYYLRTLIKIVTNQDDETKGDWS